MTRSRIGLVVLCITFVMLVGIAILIAVGPFPQLDQNNKRAVGVGTVLFFALLNAVGIGIYVYRNKRGIETRAGALGYK